VWDCESVTVPVGAPCLALVLVRPVPGATLQNQRGDTVACVLLIVSSRRRPGRGSQRSLPAGQPPPKRWSLLRPLPSQHGGPGTTNPPLHHEFPGGAAPTGHGRSTANPALATSNRAPARPDQIGPNSGVRNIQGRSGAAATPRGYRAGVPAPATDHPRRGLRASRPGRTIGTGGTRSPLPGKGDHRLDGNPRACQVLPCNMFVWLVLVRSERKVLLADC
jgi:hypothetical protein